MVAHATGGAGANLIGFGGPVPLSLNLFTGREKALAEQYFVRRELWGRCNWRVNSSPEPMRIKYERHYRAYRETSDTSDYDDAVSDLDMQFGCQSGLINDTRTFIGLAVYRGRREGPSDALAVETFQRLLRPVQRALRLQPALSGEAAELMLGDLSLLHSAVVLLDRHGCVCALTPAAEPLAEAGGPVRLDGLLFGLANPEDNRRMLAALASLLSEGTEDDACWVHEMCIGGGAGEQGAGWIAAAFRLPQRDHGLGFNPHVAVAFEPLQDSSTRSR